ncbi:MAG: DegT/DnrJ/EryC1/StrS family aminotransferase [Rhodospirillales bacterium]|nr:DegT/DnrJ/EryC1/StrS family aminotransferase [Rhodospirillales bacterium]
MIDARIATVLGHGRFVNGPEVAELETALAARSGAKHVVAVANGTDALNIALRTERIGPGDAVFVPAFSFVATGGAVALNGATPIFVDIDPRTFVMDPSVLADTIRHVRSAGDLVPRAVMPVDLFGLPADYGRLEPLCREEGLFLLVDGAQSFGASQHGRRVGAFGDATITSFFPSKPLGAWGDGGAMFTDDRARMEQWRVVCAHGTSGDPYDAQRIGTNSRLDTLQAAVLLAKLPGYQDEIARRNVIADAYTEALRDLAEIPVVPDGNVSVWAQYSLLVDRRDAVRAALTERGIPTRVYYPRTLPAQMAFRGSARLGLPCPAAADITTRVVNLPMHSELDDLMVARVIAALRDVLRHRPGTQR